MSKKYTELTMEGIFVYLDRLIAKEGQVYFGSCFGGAESVKAALSGLVSGKAWNTAERQYSRSVMNYSIRSQRVAGTNIVHGIAYIPALFDVRRDVKAVNVVFGERAEDIEEKVFGLLKKRSSVPALDCWRGYILRNTVEFIELETFGIKEAYEVELPEDSLLEEFIMSEIKTLKLMEAESWSLSQKITM